MRDLYARIVLALIRPALERWIEEGHPADDELTELARTMSVQMTELAENQKRWTKAAEEAASLVRSWDVGGLPEKRSTF